MAQELSSKDASRRRRALREMFWLKVGPPRTTPDEAGPRDDVSELITELRTSVNNANRDADESAGDKLDFALADAERRFDRYIDRRRGAEQRAATLQGAIAIAFGLLVGAGGLLIDPAKTPSGTWRNLLAIIFVVLLACLFASGVHAVRALAKTHHARGITIRDVKRRAGLSLKEAKLDSIASLLVATWQNNPYADFKVASVRSAANWLRVALLVFVVLGVVLALYILTAAPPPRAA
jgi:hypothetical protein